MPGQWEPLMEPWPSLSPGLNAIHMALLRTGHILVFGSGRDPPPSFRTTTLLCDASNLQAEPVDVTNRTTNMFCAGHCALADGRVLVAGGGFYPGGPVGIMLEGPPFLRTAPRDANIFDPAVPPAWRSVPLLMRCRRHYPTCTTLWDRRVLISAGWRTQGPVTHAEQMELFDPETSTFGLLSPVRQQKLYPFMFVLPEGVVLDAGPAVRSQKLFPPDPPTHPEWRWEEDPDSNPPAAGIDNGSAVMYDAPDGLILKCGGSLWATDALKATALFDPQASSWWQAGPDMNFRRRNHNLVVLPDQTILAVGGNKVFDGWQPGAEPVLEAEIFDPNAGTPAWVRTFVEMEDPRWYHSTALLLPDARVLVAGGNLRGSYTRHSAQVSRPPYLDGNPDRADFGDDPAPPGIMHYNSAYQFEYTHPSSTATITKACLIRLPCVTHGFDQDQRYVRLDVTEGDDRILTVASPLNGYIAPPGWYMLFIVDDDGVPCKLARFVQVTP
jgi:hypothetical protein